MVFGQKTRRQRTCISRVTFVTPHVAIPHRIHWYLPHDERQGAKWGVEEVEGLLRMGLGFGISSGLNPRDETLGAVWWMPTDYKCTTLQHAH